MADMAQEYAETIREELQAWERLHQIWQAIGQDPRVAAVELDGDAGTLARQAREELEGAGGWGVVAEYGSVASLYTDTNALDAWTVAHHRYDTDPEPVSVVILRTAGGPHCEIVASLTDPGSVEVITAWGTDTGRAWLRSEMIAEAAELAAEAIAYGVQA